MWNANFVSLPNIKTSSSLMSSIAGLAGATADVHCYDVSSNKWSRQSITISILTFFCIQKFSMLLQLFVVQGSIGCIRESSNVSSNHNNTVLGSHHLASLLHQELHMWQLQLEPWWSFRYYFSSTTGCIVLLTRLVSNLLFVTNSSLAYYSKQIFVLFAV